VVSSTDSADVRPILKGPLNPIKHALLIGLSAGIALGSGCRQDPEKQAEDLIESGKYREAISKLETLVQKEERGRSLLLLGDAYARLKDFNQADSCYRRALSSDSTLKSKVLTAYLYLGDELSSSKEDPLAVKAWERVLTLAPDYELEERFYHLGDYYFTSQNYRRASQLYARALSSSPFSQLAREGRYRLVLSLERLGELEQALRWCQESGASANGDLLYEEGKIAYSLAEKSLRDGDAERALQLLRRTMELEQPRILLDDAYFMAGEIHFQREEYEEALGFYRKVISTSPYQKGGVVQKARARIQEVKSKRGAGK